MPVPEQLLAACVAVTDTPVVIADATDPDQPLIWVNAAFETVSGYPAAHVLGRNARLLQGPDTDPTAVAGLAAALRAGLPSRTRLRNYRPDGSSWWNEMHLSPLRDPTGALTHWLGLHHDVTTEMDLQARVAHTANHDPLTGLANQASFTDQLHRELARSTRDRRAVAVLFLDIDGLKTVNDTHGHAAGDALLVQIADRLRARLRGEDLIARLGGDEFLALLVDLSRDGSKAIASVIADLEIALADPFTFHGVTHWVGVSIGAALHPRDGTTPHQLIAAADTAMYQHKTRHTPP